MQDPVSLRLLTSLATPAIPPHLLARILVDGSRAWSERLAQLDAGGIHLSRTRARVLGSRLRLGGVSVEPGHAVPLASWLVENDSTPTLVERAGFDPAHWTLAPRQGGYVTGADGRRRRIALIRHEASPEPEAVAKLLASAMPSSRRDPAAHGGWRLLSLLG